MNKTILLHQPDLGERLFDPQANDHATDPLLALRRRLGELGYDLRTTDDRPVQGAEWVVFFDSASVYDLPMTTRLKSLLLYRSVAAKRRDVYAECIQAGLSERIALFLWEAPAVQPSNWDPNLHARFPIVFTWNDDYVDGKRYHKFRYPQPSRFPDISPRPFAEKKLLVNISGNKYRRHSTELYGERRKTIRYFERAMPNDFDLYGTGWNSPATDIQNLIPRTAPYYPSYRGPVENKWDIYPRYRFGLCYENIRDQPGYITEKLFDCMRADCVPIYWGANNVTSYIPADGFIDRRNFQSNEELSRFLTALTETTYDQYRSAIRRYLQSSQFGLFSEDTFIDTVIRGLHLEASSPKLPSPTSSSAL